MELVLTKVKTFFLPPVKYAIKKGLRRLKTMQIIWTSVALEKRLVLYLITWECENTSYKTILILI